MKMKLAIVLLCSALAGFVIAATKPPSNSAGAEESAAPAPARASAPVAATTAEKRNSPFQTSDAKPAADATGSLSQPAPAIPEADAAPPAPVENKPSGIISSDIGGRDLQFLSSALEHGRLQLYLGELAKTKADTEQVKAVGDVLSSTQLEENKKLVRLATMKGVTFPNVEPAGKKAVAAKLEKLSGPKFDKMVMEEIINVNQRAVATYEAAANTRDGDIKAFIEQGLPLAKEKLLLANKMSGNARRSDKGPGFRANPTAPKTQ